MHYYTHNIGDYAVSTKYMTFEEKGIYVDLVDHYLATGKPLASHWLAIFKRMTSEDAVNNVLTLCFEERDGEYFSRELDEMIESYAKTAEKNRKNAQKARKTADGNPAATQSLATSNPVASQSGGSGNPVGPLTKNQEPRTKNQEPEIESASALSAQAPAPASTPARKRKPSSISSVEKPDEIDDQVWGDWLQIRKAKRLPLTQTAWDAMCVEAEKVGYTPAEAVKHAVERGWASFKAQWLLNEQEEQKRATASAEIKPLSERTMQDYESWLHPETWS